jgi:Neurotransmitter-gated ion-channel ligand binding domain
LAHTGKGSVRYPLGHIWHPRVGIVNETNSVSRKMPDSVEVDPDGTVTSRQLYVGTFTQPLRLQSFPFDRQTFRVQLVAVRYQSNEVVFVQDQIWIQDGLQGSGGIFAICYPARLDNREI